MRKIIDAFLELTKAYCDILQNYGCNVTFDETKNETYRMLVERHYYEYKEKYMDRSVKHLDRHKIAAIFVASGLECDIILPYTNNVKNEQLNIGKQKILLMGAFDFLLSETNEILGNSGLNIAPMETMLFPSPWSCETDYLDVFARNLYYEETEYGKDKINIMELSEKFFLLEYISIYQTYYSTATDVFKALKVHNKLCKDRKAK